MTTRLDIVGRVRTELGDVGAAQVWSNGLLYSWLQEGLGQLSLDLPPLRYVSFYAVPGQREYGLASYSGMGPGGVQTVEAPRGRLIQPGEVRQRQEDLSQQNTLMATDQARRIYENCWMVQEFAIGQLYLVFRYAPIAVGGPSDLLISLWYYGYYSNPPDDVTPLDLHATDESLVVWYICARALSWLAEQRGKRGDAGARRQQQATSSYYEKFYAQGVRERLRAKGAKTARLLRDA